MVSEVSSSFWAIAAGIKPAGWTEQMEESTGQTVHMILYKMAESTSFARPPKVLEISTVNPECSWEKWKQKFDNYLKAIGASKKTH